MGCNCAFHRRGVFRFAGAVAAAVGFLRTSPATAQTSPASQGGVTVDGQLPGRGEFIVRGGYVLTMDAALGDLPAGDVHVRDGTIVGVGANLVAPAAEVIDGRDMIVLPGFVETHWHLWTTALRMIIRADEPRQGYFPLTIRIGSLGTPQDAYQSVRLGVVEGLLSGITTVHNWSHNTVTPEHADAEIQALKDTGVRARFSYGTGQSLPLTSPMNLGDLARVQHQWATDDGMLGIGACLRTPGPSPRGELPMDLLREEMDGVRKLGLPMTMHGGTKNLIDLLSKNKLLGQDLLMVHPQGLTAEERQLVAESRTPYSTAPVIEMSYSAVRSGYIQYAELTELGVQLGLSIDSSGASANADFFNVMRALMWSDWQRSGSPQKLRPRRLLELATIDGARLLGLADKIGSLTPGKRADIILIRTTDINMAPVGDPYYSIVFSGQPANVDTVVVDGCILCRGGKLMAIDVAKTVREATASARAIQERAG
jgi:5-methylthioadenosine/S-adenosylhomocysteine deaminase